MTDNTKRYRDFFIETIEGQEFKNKLTDLIASEHGKAERETDKDAVYAHVQRAKGVREVLSIINSLTTEAKKGNSNG